MTPPEISQSRSTACPAVELPSMLIVGDPSRLNIAREALVELELGWEVVFAGSAFDAHDIPNLRRIDVILVDLGNPHIEGVDLVESLATNFPHVPIVLMSAPYGVSVALEAMRKGAAGHFPRELLDSEPAAVIETLRAAASHHRNRRTALVRLDNLYFEFTLPNERTEVSAISARLAEACIETGLCDPAASRRVCVALEEALLNAMIHGNLEVSSNLRQDGEAEFYNLISERSGTAPYCHRRVKVTARISALEGIFVIQDEGPGFDPASVPNPTNVDNMLRVGGRGILLMRSFMNDVHFSDQGRRVTMVKRRARR